ncbi:hypothetical protein FN846DRAFT_933322 [Sphaerosporella brunnea]|uniref:Uncharacterized protein n=1 Tax=Sphaerosporella brunnea TaxID=1250544 RepID=A0A5J5F6E3_9PEZI|nr:hypothetical protein FN846DRAFT_933322 [Sphaerosporella brunnea]
MVIPTPTQENTASAPAKKATRYRPKPDRIFRDDSSDIFPGRGWFVGGLHRPWWRGVDSDSDSAGYIPTPPPPSPPTTSATLAASKARGSITFFHTMYPAILKTAATVKVLTENPEDPPLYVHESICHLYHFASMIKEDTIVFPTKSGLAATVVLSCCYNFGVLKDLALEEEPFSFQMEVWKLAYRIGFRKLPKVICHGISKKLTYCDIAELIEYTRIRLGLEEDLLNAGADERLPKAIEIWTKDGDTRLKDAFTMGGSPLCVLMVEYPEFGAELFHLVMDRENPRAVKQRGPGKSKKRTPKA